MRSQNSLRYALSAAVLLLLPQAPVRAEGLLEALADTYTGNPRLLSARALLRATDENVPLALSAWRPSVSFTGDLGIQVTDAFSPAGAKNNSFTEPGDVRFSVTQPLFRGFRTIADTQRAENVVLAQRARLLATEQTVLLDAINAYMNVVRERALLDLSNANVEVLRKQLQATQDRFRVGELTRTDVAQAESRLQSAIADQVNASGRLTSSIATYVNVIGHEPGDLVFPAELTGLPANVALAVEDARVNNPNVVAADYDERAANFSVELVRGELYPSLSLSGTATYNTDLKPARPLRTTDVLTEALTATLSVPLYLSGSVYARLRGAKETDSQKLQDLANARRVAIEGATSAWEGLQTALATVSANEAAVRSLEIAFEGVQEEARVGARTTLDVLDAEQELFQGRVNLVKVRRDATVAAYTVYAAIGRLTAKNLGLSVTAYDPTEYYNRVRNRWAGADIDR
jgi:outer membrane protein